VLVIPRIEKFLLLSFADKALFLSSWVLLGLTRARILTRPFKQLVGGMTHHGLKLVTIEVTPAQQAEALRIGQVVAYASSATPWSSNCLTQVLTVQRLLQKRNIPGQFFLGVNQGESEFSAHAWLQCGLQVVSGGGETERYARLSTFSWV
jgi:Transglutaminase-like superfamily